MRRSSAAIYLVSAVLVFWVFRDSLLAVDDQPENKQPADPDEKPARKVQSSDKAVVRDIVYGLEEEENRLFLTS